MNANEFFSIEQRLIAMGLDADLDSFETIRDRLKEKLAVTADEFARQAIYVVLASGFSQKTAKKKHAEIMDRLIKSKTEITISDLFDIFHNKNKVSAIIKIWENRKHYRDEYYMQKTLDEKLEYIAKLPHIGKITANHLARNLGENVFKRDVWIERLLSKYDETLFDKLEQETKLPRGYIDVVLWRACQNGLIEF